MVKVKVPTRDEVRRTLRTALAVLLAVAALVPVLVELGVVDPSRAPWLATIVAAAAFVTRLMANPRVDELLGKLLGGPFTMGDGRVVPGEVVGGGAVVGPDADGPRSDSPPEV